MFSKLSLGIQLFLSGCFVVAVIKWWENVIFEQLEEKLCTANNTRPKHGEFCHFKSIFRVFQSVECSEKGRKDDKRKKNAKKKKKKGEERMQSKKACERERK